MKLNRDGSILIEVGEDAYPAQREILRNVMNYVELEDGFTLGDLGKVICNYPELFSIIPTDAVNMVLRLKECGETGSPIKYKEKPTDRIEYARLYWHGDMDEDCLNGTSWPQFDGEGIELPEDINESWGYFKKGDRINFALGLTDPKDLHHLPIKLDETFKIFNDTNALETMNFDPVFKAKKKFTLMDLVYGVFWELSWYGDAEDKDRIIEEIDEAVKSIKDLKDISDE